MIIFLIIHFHCIYINRNPENMWEWILRIWDNGGKNIKLDKAKLIEMGSLRKILHLMLQLGALESVLRV